MLRVAAPAATVGPGGAGGSQQEGWRHETGPSPHRHQGRRRGISPHKTSPRSQRSPPGAGSGRASGLQAQQQYPQYTQYPAQYPSQYHPQYPPSAQQDPASWASIAALQQRLLALHQRQLYQQPPYAQEPPQPPYAAEAPQQPYAQEPAQRLQYPAQYPPPPPHYQPQQPQWGSWWAGQGQAAADPYAYQHQGQGYGYPARAPGYPQQPQQAQQPHQPEPDSQLLAWVASRLQSALQQPSGPPGAAQHAQPQQHYQQQQQQQQDAPPWDAASLAELRYRITAAALARSAAGAAGEGLQPEPTLALPGQGGPAYEPPRQSVQAAPPALDPRGQPTAERAWQGQPGPGASGAPGGVGDMGGQWPAAGMLGGGGQLAAPLQQQQQHMGQQAEQAEQDGHATGQQGEALAPNLNPLIARYFT
jgi:hypothetical protein